uniref:SKA complex subunit 1 n=1 Tax=Latimeria chalumnae TaxID=7897 RepID=H2ZV10_LATCH
MLSSDLEDISLHINNKISTIKTTLHLRSIGKDPALETVLKKIGKDMFALNDLINAFEVEVEHQASQLNSLKELEKSFEENLKEAKHLKENIPSHLPKKAALQKWIKSAKKNPPLPLPVQEKDNITYTYREMTSIVWTPFVLCTYANNIQWYMRGRLTYDQINRVIQEINKAVVKKYKILQQPKGALNNSTRKLLYRFEEEETKDTKGQYFFVDDDIKEFTNMKLDKKFQGMLNILRHCQRLREVRGKGLVRYLLL